MKIIVKAVAIKNDWKLNKKYRGPLGWIKKHRKGKLERALGIRMTFGETEAIIDLSYMPPNKPGCLYAFLPPIPLESKDMFKVEMIPPDADLYPYDIEVISGSDDDTDTTGAVV